MAITIKNHKVLMEILAAPYHAKLIQLMIWTCIRHNPIVMTSGYRGPHGNSVHNTKPCRGLDIRSTVYNDPQAVVDDINNYATYDPARPNKKCAILHDIGKGVHIHLQVHRKTEFHNSD